MLKAGIALLTGVILACYSPQLIDSLIISWLPLCLFLSFINPHFRLTGLLIAGFLWAQAVILWQLDHRLQPEWNNKRLIVVGEVLNLPVRRNTSTSFLIRPLSIPGYSHKLPQKIRLNWRAAPESLAAGQTWQWNVKLRQPHGYQNPGGFDYEKWLMLKGVHATGYVLNNKPSRLLDQNSLGFNQFRRKIVRHIDRHCANCEFKGLIQALAVGYRANILPYQRLSLQQTGTAHLIAISGLHIGIIAGVFYWLGLVLWKTVIIHDRLNRKELALISAWLAGLAYSLLAGFDLPAQRALIMLTVVFISQLLRIPFNLLNSIVISMIAILIVSPLSVLSGSFWMTFCALLILVLGSFLLRRKEHERFYRLRQIVTIQWLFSLLFIPLSIQIFGQIHSASLLANIIAVPWVSFVIVPLNFLLLILFWLPSSFLEMLYQGLNHLLYWLMMYFDVLQQSGFQAIKLSFISTWQLILLFLIFGVFLLPAGLLKHRRYLLLMPLLILWPQRKVLPDSFKLTVLDVGMGTSIVIQTRHHSLIYDFGPGNRQGYSLGEWVVLPYLQYQGITLPDRIILSHSDQDHVGGLYSVQQAFAKTLVLSGTADDVAHLFPEINQVLSCHEALPWEWDGVRFEFLSAGVIPSDRDNNRSCVLKITTSNASILIAGDIEARQEMNLLSVMKKSLAAEILIAPHHGSLTSSTTDFIRTVGAKHVVFTAGFLNRWGFPRAEVVDRYRQNGAKTYQTDELGSIEIECHTQGCELIPYRQQHPRLWY